MALPIFTITIIAVLSATSAYSSGSEEVENTLLIAPSCDGIDVNCTTLTGYAQDSATVETNLILLPGNHILETALLFDSSSSAALQGDCFSNTNCPLINCSNSNVLIRFSNITEVTISNLNFVDCRVTAIPSFSTFVLTNNDQHSLRIANCSFTHSSNRILFISGISEATIESCSFRNVSTLNDVVRVQVSTIHICGSTSFTGNTVQQASSLVLVQTNTTFSGNTLFSDNVGGFGASVSAFNSYVIFSGEATFLRSQSNSQTGGFVSYNCTVAFYGETRFEQNSAPHIGAVIGGVNSRLKVFGNLTFYNNSAQQLAGALGLTYGSQIHFAQDATVIFELNRAGFEGGAIYIEDPSLCLSRPGPCFFQVDNIQDPQANLVFIDNHANVAGDDLYGGEINACMIDNTFSLGQQVFDSITTFHHSDETLSSVASDPLQVCECSNGRPNCEQSPALCTVDTPEDCSVSRTIYPGEDISVTVAAVGQGGGIVPAGIRPATNNDNLDINIGRGIPISDDVVIRGINATCTTLTYTMTSLDPVVILSLYPRASLCINTDIPLPIAVNFIQPCPYGFETDPSTGQCTCQTRLLKLDVSCDISTRSFRHRGEHWIGFDNATKEIIIHEARCPFDYCLTDQDVVFTLEDTDTECSFNRSGLLCGQCKNGLSVQLGGTSQCKPCSNAYISLLIPIAIAGIALVILLFACELSVAVGTLSGLIFYANLVQVNQSLLFQSSTNILSIFIAWLNLDLGISTCFYNGMDVYASTWLQFVFPFYIWAVVGLIIFVSGYSKRVTMLLGSHPIAVLATLFLLSYVKILRVCLAVVKFERLEYTDSTILVWEPDANIRYFQGKHIPLFLFTFLVFVLLVLPYTAILLFGQWIQTNIKWKRLAWFTRSQRLKAFLDVYHAPYKDKHRYWPGLLLVCRIILPIASAGSDAQSLFALSATTVVIVLLIQLWGVTVRGVYKKWPLDTLEGFFLVNLGMLMFITYHIQQYGGNQEAATAISVSFVLVAFIGILLYHILILRLKLSVPSARLWLAKSKRGVQRGRRGTQTVEGNVALDHPAVKQGEAVTISYISIREVLLEENPT